MATEDDDPGERLPPLNPAGCLDALSELLRPFEPTEVVVHHPTLGADPIVIKTQPGGIEITRGAWLVWMPYGGVVDGLRYAEREIDRLILEAGEEEA